MVKIQEQHTYRRYIITQKELKEAFKMKGDITKIALWSDEIAEITKDNNEYYFDVKEEGETVG
jgi:hypothetical protein